MQIFCKYDELVDPKSLKDHPKNRNKHGQDQIERLAELYKYHGVRHPIIVSNLTGFVVAGHGRKLAAIRARIKEFPVVYQDFETSEAEYAFIQADNAIAAWSELDLSGINADIGDLGPDFDINMLGIKDFTLDVADKDPGCDEDEVPEQVEPTCKLGQIWKLGDHRLMCGDSTDAATVEKLMDGQKADMVFTDPPYGINYSGKDMNFPGAQEFSVLNNDDGDVGDLVRATLAFQCKKVIWGANNFFQHLPHSGVWCVWDKRSDGIDDHSLADGVFGSQAELAWIDKKTGYQKIYRIKHSGGLNKDGGRRIHPTQKPTVLAIECFEHEKAGPNIIDLFGGSGSTLIACEKTNRKCFMMELDPHYCDVIIARWEKYSGKKAEIIHG